DVALFFYAGHGMQVTGRNYLIPVDAKLEDATSVDFETIPADRVLDYMVGGGKVAIALLDACRDNPLSRRFARALGASRSAAVGRGLAIPTALGAVFSSALPPHRARLRLTGTMRTARSPRRC